MSVHAKPMLGVLGGMGPLATAIFMRRLIELTPAERDQDHVPMLVWSCPQIPDRVGPIMGDPSAPSPLPMLREGIDKLVTGGAAVIAIPCNTVHHWFDEMRAASPVPIINILDAVAEECRLQARPGARIGVLATEATFKAGLYQRRLAGAGFHMVRLEETDARRLLLPGIADVKRNQIARAAQSFRRCIELLAQRGADAVVFACTEIPVAVGSESPAGGPAHIDSLDALAKMCLAWQTTV
jgi:aspartate racemase